MTVDQQFNYETVLRKNIDWFLNSGIMHPADGSWGVAERIVLKEGNEALEKIFTSLPAYLEYETYAVLEHRRPDCNFQSALMFVLAAQVLRESEYQRIADNILRYLYCRSGLRNTNESYPYGVWKWSNAQWDPTIYFDDNCWNSVVPLVLSRLDQGLESKYNLRESGLTAASAMQRGFDQMFGSRVEENDSRYWSGNLLSPHWGSMACMAFAYAYGETEEHKYLQSAVAYHQYIIENVDKFTASELAYVLMGGSACCNFMGIHGFYDITLKAAEAIVAKMDVDTGNVASEWDRETPAGIHLVDTIYTQNWVLFGLYMFLAVSREKEEKYRNALIKSLQLLSEIQIESPENHLHGCWRGMYDLRLREWGGGNRFEGGSHSVYSGWTNAPISIVAALSMQGRNILNH